MNNSRTASFLFLAVLAGSSLIMSCKSSSTSPAASAGSMPNPGSIITVQESSYGSPVTIVYTVFATSVTNPNTNASAIELIGQRSDNNHYDTMYWAYESNGDISIYPNPSTDRTTWWTLPFASQTNKSTSFTTGQPDPSYDTTTFAGSRAGAAFSIGGQSYKADSVTVTVTQLFTQTPPAAISVFHYTELPAIGIIGIMDADNGAQDMVIAYTPK